MSRLEIVPESPAHVPDIRKLLAEAFPQHDEADLVDRLRDSGGLSVAQVAIENGRVCAYAAVSPMFPSAKEGAAPLYALAPVAVTPGAQGRGLGARVIRAAIAACENLDGAGLTVLGDPGYYARFGFVPAEKYGISIRGADFGGAFQVLPINGRDPSRGAYRWHPAFDPLLEKDG